MRRLLHALRRCRRESVDVTTLLCDVTLADLGAYVSDVHASRYMRDRSYALAPHLLRLDTALQSSPRDAQSNNAPARAAVPRVSSVCNGAASAAAAAAATSAPSPSPASWKRGLHDVIGCSTLYEDDDVCVCWFVVPPGRVLPLHDHPGMCVWQRVLVGTLHLVALDWVAGNDDKRAVAATTASATAATATAVSPVDDNDDDEEGRHYTRNRDTTSSGRRHDTHSRLVVDAHATARALRRDHAHAQCGGEAVVVFADTVQGVPTRCGVGDVAHFCAQCGGGVLHELANVHPTQPALFLDVIAPPYHRPPHDIACTYFAVHRRDNTSRLVDGDDDVSRRDGCVGDGGGGGVGHDAMCCGGRAVRVGERVHVTPRHDYHGPAMDAYVSVVTNDDGRRRHGNEHAT